MRAPAVGLDDRQIRRRILQEPTMVFSLTGPHLACAFCPIGKVSHVSDGGHCPMVDRRRPAGTLLYIAGSPADAVYHVKHGAIALSRGTSEKHGESAPHAVRRAGSLIGLEAIVQ